MAALALPAEALRRTALVLVSPVIPSEDSAGLTGDARAARRVFAPPRWCLRLTSWLLPWLLRRLVHRRGFWPKALQAAGGGNSVDDELVMHYRWPSLVEGWDRGLASWVISRLAFGGEASGLAARLRKAKDDGLRVLVVHGEEDPLVPLGGSEALARALGAPLARSGSGHSPHEDSPGDFAEVVSGFVLGDREARRRQGHQKT